MTAKIDFSKNALHLAYVFYGEYHDEAGELRSVRWCGPKGRVGSGLLFPLPANVSSSGSARTTVWEARLSRCSFDMNLGGWDQHIQTVNDLSFNVDISGGPQATDGNIGDLRRDIIHGRWRNKRGFLWLVDLDTNDYQLVASGAFDRNPTAISANNFAITLGVTALVPSTIRFPCTQIPENANSYTYDQASIFNGFTYYLPTQYMLSPDHKGKYIGPTFGHATAAGDNYVWREVVPFGRRTNHQSGAFVFCFVSPITNCFVSEVFVEQSNNDNRPYSVTPTGTVGGLMLETINNLDPTRGPVGTWLRFSTGSTQNFIWWGNQFRDVDPANPGNTEGGPMSRVFARVAGHGTGVFDRVEFDTLGDNPVEVLKDGGSPASTLWDVLDDLVSNPALMNSPGTVWGTGAVSDFRSSSPAPPAVQNSVEYYNLACAVPRDIVEEQPSFREMIQSLASSFPFDVVDRLDPALDEWRWYPIWRSGFLSEPDHIFTVADMSRTDPPSIQQYDNADGKYANQVNVRTPEYYSRPTNATTSFAPGQNAGGEDKIDPTYQEAFRYNDVFEQGSTKEDLVVPDSLEWDHWLHTGNLGNGSAALILGTERAQPQRTVMALHGHRSFSVAMGAYVRYSIPGVNKEVGMVRKMRFDYDLQQVQMTTYHVDHPVGGKATEKENKAYLEEPEYTDNE
jgi:hypothetical protein